MSRVGNFSSSEIWKLTTNGRKKDEPGKPFFTYIKQKRQERRLGKSLRQETNARSTNWGKFVEKRAFDLLSLDYKLVSKDRYQHDELKCWTGMPDSIRDNIVGDIKCPWTLESFMDLYETLESRDVEVLKSSNREYYWQLVSNAILTVCDKAELIIYAPYVSEIEEIRNMAADYDGDQNKIAFIEWAGNDELPLIPDDSEIKNLIKFEFTVPESDKELLYNRVKEAHKLLEAK